MSKECVTIVSGLPRSGTSVMMQMLAAGGAQVLADNQRVADEHNPRGYFELEAVRHSRTDVSWIEKAGGKAVKVIHLLLPNLPADREYRVIFMRRDLAEVIASQRAMLQRQGRPGAVLPDSKLAEVFEKQLAEVRQWLGQHSNFQVLEVQHRELIDSPQTTAERVAAFLGGGLDAVRMAAVVEPGLYHQRAQKS